MFVIGWLILQSYLFQLHITVFKELRPWGLGMEEHAHFAGRKGEARRNPLERKAKVCFLPDVKLRLETKCG